MAKFFCTHGDGHTVTVKPEKGTMTYDPRNLTCPTHHKPLLTGMQLNARKPRVATKEGPKRKRSSLKRGKGFAASKAQREKVAGLVCVVCGDEEGDVQAAGFAQIDPAHLLSRALGGCDHKDCVVPLCRTCHRQFDQGDVASLKLLERLVERERFTEIAHMIDAHHLSPLTVLERLSGTEWQAVERQLEAV